MELWKPTRRTILRAGGLIACPAIIGRALAPAHACMTLTGAGGACGGGGAAAATTWSNTDKSSANLVLSNSSRTVTYSNVGNTNEGIRSVKATTANQLVYIEHVIGTLATGWAFGFAVVGASLAGGLGIASATPTLAMGIATSGQFVDADSPDATLGTIPALVSGNRIGLAYNTLTQKLWARKNGGAWNVTIGGAQDPTGAGTGGLRVVLTGSPFFAWAGLDANTGDVFTTNFASGDWVDAAPAGYSQLAA